MMINLIPAEIVHAAARRVRLLRWSLCVSLSGLLAMLPYTLTLSRKAEAADLRRQIDQFEQESGGLRTQLRGATARTAALLSELERSNALRTKRAWSGMFALLAAALPADCWLHAVATDPEAPGVGSARPPVAVPATAAAREPVTIEAPRKLRLLGYSTSDSQPLIFVSNLRESQAFAKVALQRAQRAPAAQAEGQESLYQFEIVCEW